MALVTLKISHVCKPKDRISKKSSVFFCRCNQISPMFLRPTIKSKSIMGMSEIIDDRKIIIRLNCLPGRAPESKKCSAFSYRCVSKNFRHSSLNPVIKSENTMTIAEVTNDRKKIILFYRVSERAPND